jgi:hypothetical protein
MKGPQFNLLVANLKRDGVMTSFPLVAKRGDDLVVVSGNHRVAAAIKAGIVESDVIEVTSPLTRQQFVALQLSHNAIVGQDDPSVLRSLYDELDFTWKEYSGLTDDAFDVEELDLSALSVHAPFYEELRISFLPGDRDVFTDWLAKMPTGKPVETLVGEYKDFTLFFETLLAVKAAKHVHNSAVAIRLMAELAGQALAAEELTRGDAHKADSAETHPGKPRKKAA